MKTPSGLIALSALWGAGLLAVTGCHGDSLEPPVTHVAPVAAVPLPAPPSTVTPETPPPVAPSPVGLTNAPGKDAAPIATLPVQRLQLPVVVDHVAEMAQAQVGDKVLLEYVQQTSNSFELQPDQIVYLKDLGLSDDVLAGLVKRGKDLRDQGAPPSPLTPAASTPLHLTSPPGATTAPSSVKEGPPPPSPGAPAASVAPGGPATPTPVGAPPSPEYVGAPAVAAPVTQGPPPAALAPVTQPVDDGYWYSTLSPYGSWVFLTGYGWCWQPTCSVVDPLWQPYCQGGRWLWSESGWYWNSSYSWGWAPFHYGRWHRNPRCGWVWLPGSVWGPAWVTWRTCDSHWGWAPLPPEACWTPGLGLTWFGSSVSFRFGFNLGWNCFTFVPCHRFCDPRPAFCAAPRHEARTIYNQTTVINNFVIGSHNTIVNRGIPPERYTQLTRREVPSVRFDDVRTGGSVPSRPERLSADGSRLAVYRPTPPVQPAPVSPGSPRGLPQLDRNGNVRPPGTYSSPAEPGRYTAQAAAPVAPGANAFGPRRAGTVTSPQNPTFNPAAPGRTFNAPVPVSRGEAPVLRTPAPPAGVPSRYGPSSAPAVPTYTPPAAQRPAYNPPNGQPARTYAPAPMPVTPVAPRFSAPPAPSAPAPAAPAARTAPPNRP